jgi:hypothetical protein
MQTTGAACILIVAMTSLDVGSYTRRLGETASATNTKGRGAPGRDTKLTQPGQKGSAASTGLVETMSKVLTL